MHLKKTLAAMAAMAVPAMLALTVAAPSHADPRVPIGASGNSMLRFSAAGLKPLYSNPTCGGFVEVDSTGGASLSVSGMFLNKVAVTLPITGVVVNPGDGHFRILHSGSGVEFANNCYDLRLTNFYIQDFGLGTQTTVFDVSAKALEDGVPDGRTTSFQLDLTNANFSESAHGATKIRSANLLLGAEGADQFNNLANGTTTGPYFPGEQVGKARTSIKFQY